MEMKKVDDLMVPIEEYATVGEEATLYEAVKALEKAQEEFNYKHSFYRHRAILVLDDQKKVVGKISQLDILSALEPKYRDMGDMSHLSRAGFSGNFIESMIEKFDLYSMPFSEMCAIAADLKVKDFMYTPGAGEYIEADRLLYEAIHMFVAGHHHGLIVTRNGLIAGVLRLTDVFKEIYQTMESQRIRSN